MGNILCLALIGLTLATCIPLHHNIPYYHMIDEEDYQAFVWIRDNVSEDYERAILDPWKATAFTAITMKNVYTRIHMGPKDTDKEAYAFLSGGCTDTLFLKEHGVSIVYTRGDCRNPDLVEVRKYVYLLKPRERISLCPTSSKANFISYLRFSPSTKAKDLSLEKGCTQLLLCMGCFAL